MKSFIFICYVIFICMFNTNAFAEELALFDSNDSAKVYLIKKSLVQENQTVRTVWVKYEYTKFGSINLKKDFNLKRIPSYSKVKYGFDCTSDKHKVMYAAIYDFKGSSINTITNGNVEEVVPGSVGEAIRNLVCNYDFENDKYREQI